MARSFAEAFEAVAGPAFDAVVGYTIPARHRKPTEDAIDAAFMGLNYEPFRRVARRLAKRHRCEPGLGEEAVQEAIAYLLEKDPRLFRENPLNWLGLLYEVSKYRLHVVRRGHGRATSIEALIESGAEDKVDRADPVVALGQSDDCKDVLPPMHGEAWSEMQILGALQRFHWYHGRAPKERECKAAHLLPGRATIRRHFGGLTEALLAAGIAPETPQRRRPWGPVEATDACYSFRWRNQRWPDGSDADRSPGVLPNRDAMLRFFGGTSAAEVQIGAEEIRAAGC